MTIIKQIHNTEEQFNDFYTRLKLHRCPHCNFSSFLILHGFLYGFCEHSGLTRKRGRRVFCSNRNKKTGCGKTFSILKSDIIKKYIISAITIWKFLSKIKDGKSLADAFRQSGSRLEESSAYRIFNKFKFNQSRIRTELTKAKDPPQISHSKNPVIQTIHHLASVFKKKPCPVAQFQYDFQKSFF